MEEVFAFGAEWKSTFCLTKGQVAILSQHLGPRFYGLGFTVAVAITSLASLHALSRKLDRLEYETFMR